MQQGFAQNFKIRTSVLVFLKNAVAPLVLYFDNPKQEYAELLEFCKNQNTIGKLIEKETIGPIKKLHLCPIRFAQLPCKKSRL